MKRTAFLRSASLCLSVSGLLILVGCNGGDTATVPDNTVTAQHDHHDHGGEGHHPETYAEAVEQLSTMDQTIRQAFANDDTETAHGPLHDIGHLLEDVAALSAKAEMTEEQQASVKEAVDKLFELYGAVDDTMHNREGKSYDEVSADIDTALDALKNASAPAAEETPTDESTE